MSVQTAPRTTGPSRRDLDLHATVCAQPATGQTFGDRCTCPHIRGRHLNAEHAPISLGRQVACSGRNSAGPCRDCDCPQFTPRPEEATP